MKYIRRNSNGVALNREIFFYWGLSSFTKVKLVAHSLLILGFINSIIWRKIVNYRNLFFFVILSASTSQSALAQFEITGSTAPCENSKEEYSYCRTENFSYIWRWSVTGDASVGNFKINENCYLVEITFRKQPITLTFHQKNPPNVPQVYNVTKQITPKKCKD